MDANPALPRPSAGLIPPADAGAAPHSAENSGPRQYLWLSALILGYIGVYLCRKNLAVAMPLLQNEFGVSKAEVGKIASYSTVAYAVGKLAFGPIIDRFGGRFCFFASLLLVVLFGGLGAFAGSLGALTALYSGNRLAGSAAWGSMVKLAPDWFDARRLPFAMALLSLSFVFGGVCATLLAGELAAWSGNNWRVVMGAPALVLLGILIFTAFVLPKGALKAASGEEADRKGGFDLKQITELLKIRQFWVVCGLSFTLTLMRETFNTWTVDFFKTEGGADMSMRIAAFLSTPFDALGALGIVLLGWYFGRLSRRGRSRLLFLILIALTGLIWSLPSLFKMHIALVTAAVGMIGFLAYGPYSLLAGIFAVEIRGKAYVATVAGLVDGVGYLAGIFAGQYFGKIVDHGGYRLGFQCLAGLTLISAILCLFIYSKNQAASPDKLEGN